MADKFSFDIVSEIDWQEVANAVDQAQREILTRYDFKGTSAGIEYEKREQPMIVTGDHEAQLEAVRRVMIEKLIKRSVEPKVMDPQEPDKASGGTLRQTVNWRAGIDRDTAKKITKQIKALKLKVNASVQGEAIRVSSNKKDELQAVIAEVKQNGPEDIPLQFTNYR
jgi:uncharacterized protein YajQ (UPF0234 family)